MSNVDIRSAKRADWDQALVDIADYVCNFEVDINKLIRPAADYVGPGLQEWVAIEDRA